MLRVGATTTTTMMASSGRRRLLVMRTAAKLVGAGTLVGGTGVALYMSTEQGRGLRRTFHFWQGVAPVIWDYYWNFASSSPYVKYQQWQLSLSSSSSSSLPLLRNGKNRSSSSETELAEAEPSLLLQNGKAGSSSKEEELAEAEKQRRQRRKEALQLLHEKHAPEILNVLLQLKGLYVKLGQVLSVTALPLPEPYREQFRTLQSDVPTYEAFENSVRPVLERELGGPLAEIFTSINPVPCGAASIGQAHHAVLSSRGDGNNEQPEKHEVIVKVQYPDAAWQIPADIQCVGDLLRLCVFFGVVDESAANLSFNEFSRQFLAELDYEQERRNLQDIYQSTLDFDQSPYQRRNVVVPRVYPELCTSKVIVMEYLPGPKLEEEARRQLEALGIDTKQGLRGLLGGGARKGLTATTINRDDGATATTEVTSTDPATASSDEPLAAESTMPDTTSTKSDDTAAEGTRNPANIRSKAAQWASQVVSVDAMFGTARFARRLQLWTTVAAVQTIEFVKMIPIARSLVLPAKLQSWAHEHRTAAQQVQRLQLTQEWIDALFDVHGHQIFSLGLFNADAHPGNILIVQEDDSKNTTRIRRQKPIKLGLIDFGQCKRLTRHEQVQVARLLVSVANNESDAKIAAAFRDLGVQTKKDSTEFLAKFAKLMFGPLQSYHLDHSWHQKLHRQDAVTYFPNELSMVYRTSMLLRGLAMSLQFNVSVGDLWKSHAQEAIERFGSTASTLESQQEVPEEKAVRLVRRMTTVEVVDELVQDYAAVQK